MGRYLKWMIAAVLVAAIPVTAQADYVYNFYRLTDGGNGVNLGSQLFMTVSDPGNNQVAFTFTNHIGIASSITDVYFDDGTLLGISSLSMSPGVAFNTPATPGNLPGGNLANPPFVTTEDFSADSDSPVKPEGVNAVGEWLTITFDLISGKTFTETISALTDGSLRVGLHVQAIGTVGGSDSYINNSFPIPAPAAVLLGVIGIGLVGWLSRRLS